MDSDNNIGIVPRELKSLLLPVGSDGPLEENVTNVAFNALMTSQFYKEQRMSRIALFEKVYNNDIPPRFRQTHNVIVPVFAGLVDTMLADWDDEISVKYEETKPSDYLTLPKVQAHFDSELKSLEPNARWNYKARTDRFNACLSGVSILQNYAESEPEYRNVLETINYTDFHCQALGGGMIENHLFAGREGIFRTMAEIVSNESYPKEQRDKIELYSWSSPEWQQIETTYGTKLTRFHSLGLDPESNSFTGDRTVNLCRFVVTYLGRRYSVLFDPVTRVWLEVKPWTNKKTGKNRKYPWKAAHTHEDHKNFWSKSFADDFYPVSENVNVLVNQEVTNREKANNNAIAFDPKMFDDAARLDRAQYTPGTMVPYNSMVDGEVRSAESGIFQFKTAELTGTIELSQSLLQMLEKYTGAGELNMANLPKGTKPSVAVAMQQQQAKRTAYRMNSFKECYAELALSFFEEMVEHMPAKMSVRLLGENGFIEEADLTRAEVLAIRNPTCRATSTSEQENANNMKQQAHVQAIEMLAQNPNLNSFEKEVILRNIGKFSESEIAFALENVPYTARKQIAHASLAIQDMLKDKSPEPYYGADVSYSRYIFQFYVDNKQKIVKKRGRAKLFSDFMNSIAPIVQQNMQAQGKRDASQMARQKASQAAAGGQGQGGPTAGGGPAKSPVQMAQRMGQSLK